MALFFAEFNLIIALGAERAATALDPSCFPPHLLDSKLMSFMTHLECPRCGKTYAVAEILTVCDCGSPLYARYDLRRASTRLELKSLKPRENSLWRYREVLPVGNDESIVALGEGFSPLLHARRLGDRMGLANLYLKNEALNPTGSIEARGMAVAVSKARELGIGKLCMASSGNSGGALAAYAAKGGMAAALFMAEDTCTAVRIECALHGAQVTLVPGAITDCARVMRETLKDGGWFDVSSLSEPYRLEGKKTLAYEIWEQMGGRLPDAIIYPTGSGMGLVGMWKAFDEMQEMSLIRDRRPRMFAVQSHGCAPLVRAYAEGAEKATEWQNPQTIASDLRVPETIGDSLVLQAVRKSRGAALAVSDSAMLGGVRLIAETEGILTSAEGGASLAGLERMLADGFLGGHESILLVLPGSGYKDLKVLQHLVEDEKK